MIIYVLHAKEGSLIQSMLPMQKDCSLMISVAELFLFAGSRKLHETSGASPEDSRSLHERLWRTWRDLK